MKVDFFSILLYNILYYVMQMGGGVEMKKIHGLFGFRAGDAAAILVILVSAILLLFLLGGSEAAEVQILSDNGTETISLDSPKRYTVSSGGCTLTIAVENRSVRVEESDCPGGDCMHTGAISRAGQSIVCMPGHVVVKIVGEETSDADWILP